MAPGDPRRPQETPRRPQEAPGLPGGSQEVPRSPPGGPRRPQEAPGRSKETPEGPRYKLGQADSPEKLFSSTGRGKSPSGAFPDGLFLVRQVEKSIWGLPRRYPEPLVGACDRLFHLPEREKSAPIVTTQS